MNDLSSVEFALRIVVPKGVNVRDLVINNRTSESFPAFLEPARLFRVRAIARNRLATEGNKIGTNPIEHISLELLTFEIKLIGFTKVQICELKDGKLAVRVEAHSRAREGQKSSNQKEEDRTGRLEWSHFREIINLFIAILRFKYLRE